MKYKDLSISYNFHFSALTRDGNASGNIIFLARMFVRFTSAQIGNIPRAESDERIYLKMNTLIRLVCA
jgi:hypothetical protein